MIQCTWGEKRFSDNLNIEQTASKTYLRCEYGRLNGNISAKIRLSSVTDRTTQKRQAVNSNEDKIAVFGHLDFRIFFFKTKDDRANTVARLQLH